MSDYEKFMDKYLPRYRGCWSATATTKEEYKALRRSLQVLHEGALCKARLSKEAGKIVPKLRELYKHYLTSLLLRETRSPREMRLTPWLIVLDIDGVPVKMYVPRAFSEFSARQRALAALGIDSWHRLSVKTISAEQVEEVAFQV